MSGKQRSVGVFRFVENVRKAFCLSLVTIACVWGVPSSIAHEASKLSLTSSIVSEDVPYGGDNSSDIEKNKVFDSELDAVIAATNLYNPISIKEDREFMGAILKCSGKFYYSAAKGEKSKDRISVELSVPKHCDLIAFWHTHGAEHYSRQYFSKQDTMLVKQWQKPLYLADYTGVLKVYKPGDRTLRQMEAKRLRLGKNIGFAKGSIVKSNAGKPVNVAIKKASPNHQFLVGR